MSTIKDIARILVEKHKMKVGASELFLQQMVEVINEGLLQDRLVKIKGFGTFKLQEVKERNSVNVNTGERVLIAAHDKIVFTPDNLMRDTVNKPFAHFETVVMGDNVEIPAEADVATEALAVEEPVVAEPVAVEEPVAEEPIAFEEPVAEPEPVAEEPVAVEEPAAVEEPVAEPEPVAEEPIARPVAIEEPVVEPAPVIDEEDDDNPCRGNMMLYGAIITNILVAAIFFTLGYLASKNGWFESKEPVKVEIIDNAGKKVNAKPVVKPAKAEPKAQKPDSVKPEEEKPENPNAKYDYDARIRTGGYYILGTMEEVTVKKGQTLKGISKAYLGPDMECYIEVYNNKKEVKEGDKVLIPKLKPKHKFKK